MNTDEIPIPFVHNGDSYYLYYLRLSDRIRLVRIERFEGNQNREASIISFFDLDPETKRKVLLSIQRKFPGSMMTVATS